MDIIFWDIDGTLIRTGKAGLFAFEEAVAELRLGPVDFRQIQTAGMTDHSIAGEIITALSGRPATHQESKALTGRYEELLVEHLEQRGGKIMPSVREILAALQETGALSLLLTGNSRKGAEIKLRKFGLETYFNFDRSAFCEDSPTRDDVAKRALLMAQALAVTEPARVFVIGDTPNDIRCGNSIGAHTIGVATGTFSVEELAACNPWWTVPQLPAVTDFMAKLTGARPSS